MNFYISNKKKQEIRSKVDSNQVKNASGSHENSIFKSTTPKFCWFVPCFKQEVEIIRSSTIKIN